MAYSKQGFVNGNVLDANQLIEMENGILANEEAIGQFQQGLDVYSVEETVIGTWINGKQLYRKVFSGTTNTSTSTSSNVVDVSNLNIDSVVNLYGTITLASGAMMPALIYSASGYSNIFLSKGYIKSQASTSDFTGRPLVVVLEYTKTTDEATIAVASGDELDESYSEGVQGA